MEDEYQEEAVSQAASGGLAGSPGTLGEIMTFDVLRPAAEDNAAG